MNASLLNASTILDLEGMQAPDTQGKAMSESISSAFISYHHDDRIIGEKGASSDGSAWTDGEGEKSSRYRVGRGGAWGSYPRGLRSASRIRHEPGGQPTNGPPVTPPIVHRFGG